MERWAGRVAVVTGASSGIGASITEELVKKGLKVAGLARRVERVEELAKSLKSEKGSLKALKCDVSKEEEVKETFQWVKNNLGGIDILVNNAGVAFACSPSDGLTEQWKTILDLNVLGLSICTREALNVMKEKGVDDGHIVHINSILGHIPPPNERIAMYTASKHAVTALTEGLRRDLVNKKSKIRITSVSPGLVRTEMPTKELLEKMTSLNPEDIANAVLYALGTPPHVQIHEMTVLPVGSP
ncbi:Farnesol dehydrogenase [Blattella germanica]|nr:Farnesol dehydrogenase [Blattella germanica]